MASPAPSTESTQGETQFIPQSDDEETLWKVIEITAERPKHFKVKWDGLDPFTGRPWAQSWVPKGDCTDDLRKAWKKKLKKNEEAKKAGKGKSGLSTTSRVSTPSTSTVTGGRNRSVTATATASRPLESSSTSRSRTVKTSKSSKRKRRSEEPVTDLTTSFPKEHSDRELQIVPEPEHEPEAGPSRPRKRRKIQAEIGRPLSQPQESEEQESYEVVKKKEYGKVVPNEDDSEEVFGAAEVVAVKRTVKSRMKGKSKERLKPEEAEEEEEVPLTKMGPPRGVKKDSITSTKSKSKSTSTSRSHSRSEVLIPLKLISKPMKSKPSPNRFRSSPTAFPHANESPTMSITQLPPNDNIDNDIDNEDDLNLGYPDLPEQQRHDLLFLPSSDDGYDHLEHRPLKMPNPASPDGIIDSDEIPQPSSQPQPHSPSFAGLPASDPEPAPPGGLDCSPEVPETQFPESSNAQSGVEARPDTVQCDTRGVSLAEAAASIPGISRKSSTASSKSKSGSKFKPDDPVQPVTFTSTSEPVPIVDMHQTSKPLHPVPQISPSTFHPHLPTPTPPVDDEEAEIADPPSDIEYFSSPEKQKTTDSRGLERIQHWGSNERASRGSQRDTILDSDDVLGARGQELADNEHEKREKERKTAMNSEMEKAKRALSDVMKASNGEPEFELDGIDESIVVQEMEDAYVDLSGGGGDEVEESQIMPLAQEEGSRDLVHESEQRVRQQAGEGDGVQQRADQEMNVEPPVEQAPTVDRSTSADHIAPRPKSRSTSIPVVRADVTVEELPPTLSPPRPPTPDSHALTRSQSAPVQSPSHDLRDAMSLLNVKSEEISRLEMDLILERSNSRGLTATIKRLEDALTSAQALISQPSPDAIALAELQTRRTQEQISWDAERTALVASLDALTSSKASAETDRDFFRDQYAQASGYVSTVRGENAELEQRALVAEGKARDGVGMIKAMFEEQVKTLQGDVAHWKGLAELLQEKDRRTGDEIRRKAAEEPELRVKYGESRLEIEKLEGMVFELSRERNLLKLKLDSVREQVERATNGKRDGVLNGIDTAHGDELVYRCLWRHDGDSKPCLDIFSSPEDLEMHMYADEHLVNLRPEQLLPQGNVNGHLA